MAGIGAERMLDHLVRSVADDDAWLLSVETFSALHARATSAAGVPDAVTSIGALILLERDDLTEGNAKLQGSSAVALDAAEGRQAQSRDQVFRSGANTLAAARSDVRVDVHASRREVSVAADRP